MRTTLTKGFTNNMSELTRGLVSKSIEAYKASENKQGLIDMIKKQLADHYDAMNTIGTGFAADYVKAGEIFLRLITLYNLSTVSKPVELHIDAEISAGPAKGEYVLKATKIDDGPVRISYAANGTKEDLKAGILHSVGGYYVSNEGTKNKPAFHVWVPGITCADCDSAYADLSLAVARCNYLAKNEITVSYR